MTRERVVRSGAVDLVALLSLATPVETEAPLLAEALGVTPYEAALALRVPSPTIVLRTGDRQKALDLLAKLRARGHDAVACDENAVVFAAEMAHLKTFRFDDDGFDYTSSQGGAGRVRWSEIVAVVRAVHRSRQEHLEKSTSRKIDFGRAAMSGGLMLTKKVTTSSVKAVEEREQVAYVFSSSGVPVLVRESRVHYEGLGDARRPSTVENFAALLAHVRARIPALAYDERLAAPRPGGEKVQAGAHGTSSASSTDAVDVLAHLVAMAIVRRTARATP